MAAVAKASRLTPVTPRLLTATRATSIPLVWVAFALAPPAVERHHELARAHAQQVVLAHQAVDALRIHRPTALAQFLGHARTSVAGPLHRDLLDRVA
jgi:hypothetical protein